jgi:uncharacterized protein YjiS (DUF1127 family)
METVMHKPLEFPVAFQPAKTLRFSSFYPALREWNEALRARRTQANALLGLDARILDDIGASDYRSKSYESGLWNQNPHKLLIEALIIRHPSHLNPKR